jgi:hypothetical protein
MPRRSTTCVGAVAAVLLLHPGVALGGPAVPPVPLPAPSGQIVHVSTLAQLQNAVASIASNTTIVIGPGTYNLAAPLYINGNFTNVGIRGATGKREDVVLVGKGMNGANDGGVPFGIWVGGNVQGVTIAHLTVRDVYYHPIMLNAGAQSPLIHNVRLVNAGQQLLKSSPDGAGGGVDNGIVEYSVFEYDTTSRDDDPDVEQLDKHPGRWEHLPQLSARDSTWIDRENSERPLGRDHQEQLHLPRRRRRFRHLRCRLAKHAGPAQLDLHLRHLRQPDRVPLSSHDGRRDREQRTRWTRAGTGWCGWIDLG